MVKVEPAMNITTDLSLSLNYLKNPVGKRSNPAEGVFVCKTCHKEFTSFQALGGHRTSHNRQKVKTVLGSDTRLKSKTSHECVICGMEFPMGQALGGHMRRHRSAVEQSSSKTVVQQQPDQFELLDVDNHQHSNCLQLLQLFPQ